MIRSIVEYQLNDTKDLEHLISIFQKIRNEAMKRPGYITGETLVNTEDACQVLVISTWHSLKNWQDWCTSEARLKITKQFEPLLGKPYTVRTYQYYLKREKRVWSTF